MYWLTGNNAAPNERGVPIRSTTVGAYPFHRGEPNGSGDGIGYSGWGAGTSESSSGGNPTTDRDELDDYPTSVQIGAIYEYGNTTSFTAASVPTSVSLDTTAPTITNVTSSTPNGSYTVGTTIPIQVTFSEAVTVTGTPQLTLETGSTDRTINYTSGSGSTTLTFNYAIQAGDTTSDLNYLSTSALTLNGGTIRDAAGNNAALTLPGLTSAGSLGVNKALVIDTTAPTLLSATLLSNGTQLRAIFSESLSATTSLASAFSINDSGTTVTPSGISVNDTSTVTLTVASAIRAGRTITFSYTDPTAGNDTNAVHDMAGNDVVTFSNQPVTNNSTVLNPLTTPTTLALTTVETNTATFTYTPTTNASSHTLRIWDSSSATATLLSTTTSFTSGSSLTSLTPATRYYATLQAVGNGTVYESSTASSPVYFTTAIRKPTITSQPSDTTTTVLGSASFRVTASSADSGALSYQWQQSTNAGVSYVDLPSANLATLSITTPTLSQSGERYRVIVTATKNGVSASETSSVALLTVTKASQSAITITTTTVNYGETLTLTTSGGTGTGAITYIKNSGTCDISATTLTPSAAGSCVITVTKASDATYLEESTTATITISTRPITIKAADRSATYTGSSVAVTNTYSITSGSLASGESITSLTYTYSRTSPTYNSTTAPTDAGSYTITPNAAVFSPGSSSNYAITYDTATLTVNRASQSPLTITTTSVAFGSTLTLDTDGGSGDGSVTFTKNSGSCTLSGNILTPTAVGSCTITATKALDTNYLAVTSAATIITIVQGSPSATLTFSSTTLTFGITNTLTITASVAGVVRYSANGKVIKSCRARPTSLTSPFVATCSYRPATRRPTTITATLTPTDLGFASRTTTSSTFLVARRTGARG